MAQYFQLIDRIVSGLSDPTHEARRNVYQRARTALIGQLRMDPSITEEDVARESEGLDEAISRVDAKFADRRTPPHIAELLASAKIDLSSRAADPTNGSVSVAQPHFTTAAPDAPARRRGAATSRRGDPRARQARRFGWSPLSAAAVLAALTVGTGLAIWNVRGKPRQVFVHSETQTDLGADVANSSDGVSVPAPVSSSRSASTDQATTLVDRAALLVDAPEEPQRIRVYTGMVIWSLDRNSGQGHPLAKVVKADIDIPDVKLKVVILIRKNSEPQLLASHTMEFHFLFQPGTALGNAKQITVPEMRRDEDTPTGDPLAGVPITIAENYFLVGLLRDAGKTQNMRLIIESNWFDVPVLLEPNTRAKLTLEKGAAGKRVWQDALDVWR